MSSIYNSKQLNLQFVNLVVGAHDLICPCNKPLECSIKKILQQEPSIKIEDLIKKEKCPTTTDAGDAHAGDEDGFGEGDLDLLFAGDFTEESDR